MVSIINMIVLAGALSSGALPHPRQRITLSVRPSVIQVGDSATLTWSATGFDSIYISHIGLVPAVGSRVVAPKETMRFTALAEGRRGLMIRSVKLSVVGTRGGGEFPAYDARFFYPLSAQAVGRPLDRLADHVLHVFQEVYDTAADDFLLRRQDQHVFITVRRDRPDLLDPRDRSIGGRRIAYRVVINTTEYAPRSYNYRIETLLEYRRRAERKWRVEDNPAVAIREAQRLREWINSAK